MHQTPPAYAHCLLIPTEFALDPALQKNSALLYMKSRVSHTRQNGKRLTNR